MERGKLRADNTGTGAEAIKFQLRFTTQVRNSNTFLYNTGPIKSLDDPNRNVVQSYTLTRIDKGVTTFVFVTAGTAVADGWAGPTAAARFAVSRMVPRYGEASSELPDCGYALLRCKVTVMSGAPVSSTRVPAAGDCAATVFAA